MTLILVSCLPNKKFSFCEFGKRPHFLQRGADIGITPRYMIIYTCTLMYTCTMSRGLNGIIRTKRVKL